MSKQTAVIELGYMGISVKDPDAWKSFATNMLGLQVFDEGEKDRFYLRMDYWHHRIPVCQPKPEPIDFEITYRSGRSGEHNAETHYHC